MPAPLPYPLIFSFPPSHFERLEVFGTVSQCPIFIFNTQAFNQLLYIIGTPDGYGLRFGYELAKSFAMRHQLMLNIFKSAKQVAQAACTCVVAGNYARARRYFAWAEKILREGNSREKLAIANVFVYSVAVTIDRLGEERKKVLALLPPLLQREYCEQINAFGA